MSRRTQLPPERRAPSRFSAALASALLTVAFVLPSSAEDTRPAQIEYDTPGSVPALSVLGGEQRLVYLTDHRIHPRTITLSQHDRLAWKSYSGENSNIVFEREVAGSMVCHSLVNFSIEDDELKSADIYPLDLVSFCEMEPGRYRYQVIRKDPDSRAKRRMDGVIIVQADRPTIH